MKLVRKIVALTMVSLMLLALAACGGETASGNEKSYTLKLSHYRADGAQADLDAKKFAANVAAANDSLEVVIYPAAQLGDYTTVQELVSVGDVEMQMATLSSTVDKFLQEFEERFGSLTCKDLLRNDLPKPQEHAICSGYVQAAVEIASRLIDEQEK